MPLVIILIGIGLLLMSSKTATNSDMPRGIRNNNPMNIRENQQSDFDWQGEAAGNWDSAFEEFKAPEWGIRAGVRILNTYRNRYGLTTVRGIIDRWAPPSENDTGAYIHHVAAKLGITPDTDITDAHYPALVKAIIHHENGIQPYSDEVIAQGIALA